MFVSITVDMLNGIKLYRRHWTMTSEMSVQLGNTIYKNIFLENVQLLWGGFTKIKKNVTCIHLLCLIGFSATLPYLTKFHRGIGMGVRWF